MYIQMPLDVFVSFITSNISTVCRSLEADEHLVLDCDDVAASNTITKLIFQIESLLKIKYLCYDQMI